jgi:hypothetical protein
MAIEKPVPTLVRYTPKPGGEEALLGLVRQHWPTLVRLGLASPTPVKLWRAYDKDTRKLSFLELFEWKDEGSSNVAHQTPEVMAMWEPMGHVLEKLEIIKVEPIAVDA